MRRPGRAAASFCEQCILRHSLDYSNLGWKHVGRHGSAGRKMGIPFAPFLALGGAVALFAGRRLVNAWLGL